MQKCSLKPTQWVIFTELLRESPVNYYPITSSSARFGASPNGTLFMAASLGLEVIRTVARSTSTATSSVPSPPTLALWFHSQLLVASVCTMAVPSSHVQYCGSLSRTRAHYSFLLDCRLMMTAQYTPIESGMLRSYLDFMVERMGSEIVFALGVGHSEHAACGLCVGL